MAASSRTQIPNFAAFERCEMLRGSKISVRTRVTCIHSRAGWAPESTYNECPREGVHALDAESR